MRVSSPIGELPFEPTAVAFRDGGIEVRGLMGAWPAHVQIDARDLPAVLRLIARPAAITAAVTTTVVGLARMAASRRRHSPEGN